MSGPRWEDAPLCSTHGVKACQINRCREELVRWLWLQTHKPLDRRTLCEMGGCYSWAHARGLCKRHYDESLDYSPDYRVVVNLPSRQAEAGLRRAGA